MPRIMQLGPGSRPLFIDPSRASKLSQWGYSSRCESCWKDGRVGFPTDAHSTLFDDLQRMRLLGADRYRPQAAVSTYVSQRSPVLLNEKEMQLGKVNKVFDAEWLDSRHVVCVTKCNSIFVVDALTHRITRIPVLKCSSVNVDPDSPCGIHSIAVNPSRTFLATGAEHTNAVAVYRLPTFDPVYVGESGHTDWIFDMIWLDDEFFISGARDSRLALWRVQDNMVSRSTPLTKVGKYPIYRPLTIKKVQRAEKIRALAYNSQMQEISVLSLSAYMHLFDAQTLKQKYHKKLMYCLENVCLTIQEEYKFYAVGSKSHVSFIDARTLDMKNHLVSPFRGCGIRSVSFRDSILTIGTGNGHVLFYDIRCNKFLECQCPYSKLCALVAGHGYLERDEIFQELFANEVQRNAIYAHCYDESGTRLFTAGGPLPAGLSGNYAAVWQ